MPFRKHKRNRNELITVKDCKSFFYLERARVEVDGDCLIFHQVNPDTNVPEILPFPIATYQAIFFGPGISITHRALALIARSGTLAIFTGQNLSVYYGCADVSTRSSENLQWQIAFYSDPEKRMEIVRRMYQYRFPKTQITAKGLKTYLGMEGNRMTAIYKKEARRTGVTWTKREYNIEDMDDSTPVNYALSIANHVLYGVCAAAEVADLYKAETSIPAAFEAVRDGKAHEDYDILRKRVHAYCHEYLYRARILKRIPKDLANLFQQSEQEQEQEYLAGQLDIGDGEFYKDATNYGRKIL